MPGNPTGRHRRGHSREQSNRPQRVRDSAEPRSHRRAELATQYGILGLIVFTPWALGTTVPWAIWGLNSVGWALGLLLAAKQIIRRQQDFQPPCWEAPSRRWLPRTMTVLTFLVLVWCLVSALNGTAGAEAAAGSARINWLPHSVNAADTWAAFWNATSLACVFWAARDWLLTMTGREFLSVRHVAQKEGEDAPQSLVFTDGQVREALGRWYLPRRLRLLLWVLCLNAAALAVVGMTQRMTGTDRLLWLFEDPQGRTGVTHFGPFPYRHNGATFANLIWPVALGFWWILRRRAKSSISSASRTGGGVRMVLVPCLAALAAVPAMASSRGGLLVGGLLAAASVASLLWLGGARLHASALVAVAGLSLAVAVGARLVWPQLSEALFPHVYVHPIPGKTGLEDFTLHFNYQTPDTIERISEGMAGLSQTNRQPEGAPWSIYTRLYREGTLLAGVRAGDKPAQYIANDRKFLENRHGKLTSLAFVRRGASLRLYADGVALTVPNETAAPMSLGDGPLPFRYIWIGAIGLGIPEMRTREVALYDRALTETELGALCVSRNATPATAVPTAAPQLPEPVVSFEPIWWHPRLWFSTTMADRLNLGESVSALAANHSLVLGSGPGTMSSLLKADSAASSDLQDLHAHNDWLETRVTFGLVGFALLLGLLGLAAGAPWLKGGAPVPTLLTCQILLALGGGLIHARFDFPLQNPAVLLVVLLLLCCASCLSSYRSSGASRER